MNHYLLIIPVKDQLSLVSDLQNIKYGLVKPLIVCDPTQSKVIKDHLHHPQAQIIHPAPGKDFLSSAFEYSIHHFSKNEFDGVIVLNKNIDLLSIEDLEKIIRAFEHYRKKSSIFAVTPADGKSNSLFSMDKVVDIFTKGFLEDNELLAMTLQFSLMKDLYFMDQNGGDYGVNLTLLAKNSDLDIQQVNLNKSLADIKRDHAKNPQPSEVHNFINYNSVFLKFLLASFSAFVVDISTFTLIIRAFTNQNFINIFIATAMGRILGSIVDYLINKYYVFKGSSSSSALKFAIITGIKLLLSSILIHLANQLIAGIHPAFLKMVIDVVLFVASYIIQKRFVFADES